MLVGRGLSKIIPLLVGTVIWLQRYVLVVAAGADFDQCQTAGFRLETWTSLSKGVSSEADCSSLCAAEIKKLVTRIDWKDHKNPQVTMLLNVWRKRGHRPPIPRPYSIDQCSASYRFCVRPWSALVSSLHDIHCPKISVGQQCSGSRCSVWGKALGEQCIVKLPGGYGSCYCTALLVIQKLRKEPPKEYPDPNIHCNHEDVCKRLDQKLSYDFPMSVTRWICGRSAVLIERESCYDHSNPSRPIAACPCIHQFVRPTVPLRPDCEDWSTNQKVLNLFDTPPIPFATWSTYEAPDAETYYEVNREDGMIGSSGGHTQGSDFQQLQLQSADVDGFSRFPVFEFEQHMHLDPISASQQPQQLQQLDPLAPVVDVNPASTDQMTLELDVGHRLQSINQAIDQRVPRQVFSLEEDPMLESIARQAALFDPIDISSSIPVTGFDSQFRFAAKIADRGQKRTADQMVGEKSVFNPKMLHMPERLGLDESHIELTRASLLGSQPQGEHTETTSIVDNGIRTRSFAMRVESFGDLISITRPASGNDAAVSNSARDINEADLLKELTTKGKSPML